MVRNWGKIIYWHDNKGKMRYLSTLALGWVISCFMFVAFGQSSISLESCTVTATSSDTIYVNEEFLGVTYTKVGPHENIIQHLTSVEGCDSIVTHRLIVRPDKTNTEYFVKVDGDGDGHDWDHAMSGEDFATYLPLVPDGTTFHVAEGTYHPYDFPRGVSVYPWNLNDYDNSNKFAFYVKGNNISILGGYPKDPSIGETRIPSIYKATFSGDLNEDDQWYKEWNDDIIRIFHNDINTKENTECLIYAEKSSLTLSGISFERTGRLGRGALILENSEVTMDNCIFTHNYALQDGVGATCILLINDCVLNIEKSLFEKNIVSGMGLIAYRTDYESNVNESNAKISIKNTSILDNRIEQGVLFLTSFLTKGKIDLLIDRSTIYKNSGDGYGIVCTDEGPETSLKVYNSTIVSNHFFKGGERSAIFTLNNGDRCEMLNNTILDNTLQSYNGSSTFESSIFLFKGKNDVNVKLHGNIMWDKGTVNLFYNWSDDIAVDEKYNLFSGFRFNGSSASSFEPDETDIYLGEDGVPLSNIGGMEATSANDPVVKNNGGYTPTVALKSDVTSNGKSIRFPLSETTVTKDQCGWKRMNLTCMGAFEFVDCEADPTHESCQVCGKFDTISSHNTIQVGEEFLGVTYSKAGRYDNVLQKMYDEDNGCVIVNHSIIVKPDPTKTEYYVKEDGEGDGSDWDHAMNGKDFAFCLPLVPDGTTFYVAAGTYKPIYDNNLYIPNNTSSLTYAVNSNVTILGGYPANAKEGAVSDPKNNHTIFDGDISGNDVVNETLDEDGFPLLTNEYSGDNVNNMFISYAERDLKFEIDGVVIKNSKEKVINFLTSSFYRSLKLQNDSFIYNNACVYMIKGDLEVNNSSFVKNRSYIFSASLLDRAIINDVLLEDNLGEMISIGANRLDGDNPIMKMNKVMYNHNRGTIQIHRGFDLEISNSEFQKFHQETGRISLSFILMVHPL